MVKRILWFCLALFLLFTSGTVSAQPAAQQVSGSFAIRYAGYETFKLLVGLTDATGLFGSDPGYIAPKELQMLGTTRGNARRGSYSVTLPDTPKGRPFDVTGGNNRTSDLLIFDIRLLSNVAERDHMFPNEDAIASSLKIEIDARVEGGTLLVWTVNNKQQFPTDYGQDNQLFTADDPRAALPAGWSLVNLDNKPFAITQELPSKLDLITTGGGDEVDYTGLSCDQLIPTFLDRVQRVYPFTELHHIDWQALRDKLIPASKTAQGAEDCQRLIREFANAVPDGHVNYHLPALSEDSAGGMGMRLTALTDGQIVVTLVRKDGPADNAGIQLGAVVTEWNGEPIREAAKNVVLYASNAGSPHALLDVQLRDLLRGELGSTATVTYQNPGEQPKTATLTRDEPKQAAGPETNPPDVKDNKLPSGIGYVRIESFTERSNLSSFDQAIDQLVAEDVPGIIVDIRSNPGGLSQMSDAMASRLFDKSFVVGTMYSLDGRFLYQDLVEPRPSLYKGCVAVLVDMYSASSADIFAYTLKSQQRGIIVGHTPTYGAAGTVSGGHYNLPAGAFIQVPTGGFYNDKKELVVEGEGVEPDVLVPLTSDSIFSPDDEVLDAAVEELSQCRIGA